MRNKRLIWLLGCIFTALGIGAALSRIESTSSAEVRVRITDWLKTNDTLVVSAVATNIGSETLIYEGNPPLATIQWESADSRNTTRPKALSTASYGLLRPGASQTYDFSIPAYARRVRVNCQFEGLGPRGRLLLSLPQSGIGGQLRRAVEALQRIVPERRKYFEFWSDEILPGQSNEKNPA
jgi:hypothetical protein